MQLLSVKLPMLVEKKKRRNALTNKSSKSPILIKVNDKRKEGK